MSMIEIICAVLLLIASVFIIGVIMLQESKQQGVGVIGGEASNNFLERSGDRSKEATMKKITKVVATLFFVITFALNLVIHFVK